MNLSMVRMVIKNVCACFLFALYSLNSNAQNADEMRQQFPGYDFVCQEYRQNLVLSMKDGEPVADQKTTVDMVMLTDKNVNMISRYKVYHSSYNELKSLDAYTKVPDGKKYRHVKITDQKTSNSADNSVFYDDVKETSFDFPSLTQNAIAHVEYSQHQKDAHLLIPFYPPYWQPVAKAVYTVTVPNNIRIKYLIKNDPNKLFAFSQDKGKNETTYSWTIKNLKPLDVPGDAPDMRYYQPHIIVSISSFENKNGWQPFLNSIEDLHRWNYGFIRELNVNPDPTLQKIVDSLVGDLKSEKEIAKRIYQWVQNHIRYVAFENGLEGFRPRQAAEVCNKRYGDCKDMSSIITQMLRMAGIKAYYTWIGSRDLPYRYSEIALPIVDNHMISTALIDGNWMFLDGTDAHAQFDLPPAFIQGKEALISLSANEYKILTVPIAAPEKNLIVDSTFIQLTDRGIKGHELVKYHGYFGKDLYAALSYRDEKEKKEYVNSRMGKGSNKFILGEYKITTINPEERLTEINAAFEIPGYSKKAGNEFYINLNLEKLFDNRVVDTAKRKIPMENNFNYSIRQYHILEIPEGYSVTYLPKNFSFENDLVKIDLYYTMESHRVIAAQEVKSKKLLIQPSAFEDWNKPMKALQPHYRESVVLEKK